MNSRLGYDMTMANILWVADALPPHLATVQLAAVRTAYQPPDPSWDNAQLASLIELIEREKITRQMVNTLSLKIPKHL